jgi:hypothetical protein
MSYRDILNEDRRYLILRALQSSASYRAAATLLQRFLDTFGQAVSLDMVETDIAWLKEQGLVDTQKTEFGSLATLTNRGLDVVSGRADNPGVRKPLPGELDG